MNLADQLFEVRASGAEEYSLLADSFKKNVARDIATSGQKRWRIAEEQRELLDRILLLPETRCLVLCAKDNPRHVGGWVAFTPLGKDIVVIHYMFVKWNYRPIGLSEALFRLTGVEGRRLVWTFNCRLAEKLAVRLVETGRVLSAGHVPAREFLLDLGEMHEREQTHEI